MLFIGYLAIRGTIWIFGVFTGTVFAIVLAAENYINFITETDGIYIYVICLSFFLGMVTGIVFLTIPKLGYANIGVWVALIFSLLLQNSVFYLTGSNLALYITFGVLSLIMIVVSLLELKWFIILCSSFVGGFWAIRPLGFFLPYYPNELSASRNFSIDIETPWQFYLYLISILVLTVLGTAFQICLYKKTHGRYHGKN